MKTIARILALFEVWLARPVAPWVVVALAAVIVSPSLTAGRSSDDFVRVAVEHRADIALGHEPADLYTFATGASADAERLRADGVFPWWADGSTRLHFFRPVTSLTHALDHALWPGSAVGEHAQSIVWYLLLVGAVWLLLRRSRAPRWLAVFALLLFALDDTHGAAIGWIASRNSIVCAVFGFLCLWAHDRWRRDGWRAGAALAPLLFALAMGAGEAGVATLGYLIAYAVFLDQGTRAQRMARLAPYAALVAVFGAIYALGGYGARHATQYIDPAGEPARYAGAVITRLPIYLHALLSGPPSEAWTFYPMLHPAMPYLMWAVAVLSVAGFVWVARPILRGDREGWFWLTGAALAAAPACAGFPSNRLLIFSSLGILAVVARFVVAVARGAATLYPGKGQRAFAVFTTFWLFVTSVPLSVLTLKMGATDTSKSQARFDRVDASIPADASIAGKTLVLVNPPIEPLVFYMHYARAARDAIRPAHTRVLATSGGRALTVERVDEHTLRVASDAGLLARAADMMMRSPGHDLRAGATVDVAGMQVQVERVTADGRPAAALFRFERSLDDPGLVWMVWGQRGFVAFTPPAPGARTELPAVDLVKLFTD